jgi:hypothetical protein
MTKTSSLSKKSGARERGSNIIGFITCAPLLLILSGTTVDISRFMRFTQVTNFVSQQGADILYRTCSDITIYNRPTLGSTSLTINNTSTSSAVYECTRQVQNAMQATLNTSLYGAIAMSSVLRYATTNNSCAPLVVAQPKVRTVNNLTTDPDDTQLSGSTTVIKINKGTRQDVDGNEDGDDDPKDGEGKTFQDLKNGDNLSNRALTLQNDGSISINGKSAVSSTQACARQRLVAVEVSYPFSPIVKFLPKFLNIDPGNQGNHRETSIL